MQFEFDPFICRDDDEKRPDKKKGQARDSRSPRKEGPGSAGDASGTSTPAQAAGKQRKTEDNLAVLPELSRAAPNELEVRLRALEKKFLDIEGGLDAPEREALWPELARLNAALDNNADALLCWIHALWEDSPQAGQWARTWAWSENKGQGLP